LNSNEAQKEESGYLSLPSKALGFCIGRIQELSLSSGYIVQDEGGL
jgi:hypothetical protein